MTHESRQFKLMLRSGHLDGVRKARLDMWDGIAMLAPREQLPDFLAQKEMESPGVYLLRNEKGKVPKVYIGKADVLSERIREHKRTKDWWTEVVAISSEKFLADGEVRFLEARMIAEAQKFDRVELENTATPAIRPLDEGAKANMERFLHGIKDIFFLLRIDDFVDIVSSPTIPHERLPKFEMAVPHKQGTATAVFDRDNGRFIVRKGSRAHSSWRSEDPRQVHSKRLREELEKAGVLQRESDGSYRFMKDYPFESTGSAAEVVAGGPRSGPRSWKVPGTSQTFKDWEAQQEENKHE